MLIPFRAGTEVLSRGERRCRQSFHYLGERWPAATSPHEGDHSEGPEGQEGQPQQRGDRGDEALIADLTDPTVGFCCRCPPQAQSLDSAGNSRAAPLEGT